MGHRACGPPPSTTKRSTCATAPARRGRARRRWRRASSTTPGRAIRRCGALSSAARSVSSPATCSPAARSPVRYNRGEPGAVNDRGTVAGGAGRRARRRMGCPAGTRRLRLRLPAAVLGDRAVRFQHRRPAGRERGRLVYLRTARREPARRGSRAGRDGRLTSHDGLDPPIAQQVVDALRADRHRHAVLPARRAERRLLRRPRRRHRHPPDRQPPRAGRGVHGERRLARRRATRRVLRRARPGHAQRRRRADERLLVERPHARDRGRDPDVRPRAGLRGAARARRPARDPRSAHQAGRAARRRRLGDQAAAIGARRAGLGSAATGQHRGPGQPVAHAGSRDRSSRRPRRGPPSTRTRSTAPPARSAAPNVR